MELTDTEIEDIDRRARLAGSANCWTGTSGKLAADARRLVRHVRATARPRKIIGLTGPAGAGKDLVASMIPGSHRIAFADPLYQGLAAMLGIPEGVLRDRSSKELPLADVGLSPRQLLQSLGTDWGRRMVSPDVWLRVAFWRWEQATAAGHRIIVVPDVRFSNEARQIHDEGGEVWLVHRPGVAPVAAHASESGLPLKSIDRLVSNAGTVDQLRERVAATWAKVE